MTRWMRALPFVAALALGTALAVGMALAGVMRVPPAGAQGPVLGLVINEDGNSIVAIDPVEGTLVGQLETGGVLNKPHLGVYDPAARRLYVGTKGARMAVFGLADPARPRLLADLKPGGDGEIHWLAMGGGLVWLAHEGDSAVYAYDPDDLTTPAVSFTRAQGFNTTHGAAMRPGTSELWITNRPREAPGFVLRIDTRTRTVLGQPLPTTGRAGDRPNNTAFTPDGRTAYVVNSGPNPAQVTVVDAERFAVTGQIELDGQRGRSPHAIAYERASGRMFVVNQGADTIAALDVATNRVAGYVTVGAEPHAVTVGPDGLVYATAKQGRQVTAIDPRTLEVRWALQSPAFVGPHQVVFTGAAPAAMPSTGGGGRDRSDRGPGGALAAGVLALLVLGVRLRGGGGTVR